MTATERESRKWGLDEFLDCARVTTEFLAPRTETVQAPPRPLCMYVCTSILAPWSGSASSTDRNTPTSRASYIYPGSATAETFSIEINCIMTASV
jgi:hypothetical protein